MKKSEIFDFHLLTGFLPTRVACGTELYKYDALKVCNGTWTNHLSEVTCNKCKSSALYLEMSVLLDALDERDDCTLSMDEELVWDQVVARKITKP